jgi:hypothetical protein
VSSPEADLLGRFVSAFQRGIQREVAAMRTSAAAFEVTLTAARSSARSATASSSPRRTRSSPPAARVRCGPQRGELRVTIERCEDLRIIVTSDQSIDLTALPITLVVAPWFLYERLLQALGELGVDRHAVSNALTLFGKRPHRRVAGALHCDHDALNPSQHAAVQLCSDSELAFLWGPPGTGKTRR